MYLHLKGSHFFKNFKLVFFFIYLLKDTNVLVIDNFFNNDELNKILDFVTKQEIKNYEMNPYYRYNRFYFMENENKDMINIISKNLFHQEKVIEQAVQYRDLAFQWLPYATSYETQITSYMDGDYYDWHVDHQGMEYKRILNYIIFLSKGEYEGGLCEISLNDNIPFFMHWKEKRKLYKDLKVDISLKPKFNRCLIFPSYLKHRVTPVKMKENNIFKSRLTLNGHYQMVS